MSTRSSIIKTVENNNEKYKTFAENMRRYNTAKKSEFYLECLWILYAMLEASTSDLLYYIGFTSDKKRNSATGSKKIKKDIRNIFSMTGNREQYKFNTLSGKLNRIQMVLQWSKSENKDTDVSTYQETLISVLKPIALNSEFGKELAYLDEEWRVKRNELTHALFNKNHEAAYEELPSLVENGYIAIQKINFAVNIIKKKDIRKKFKIQ